MFKIENLLGCKLENNKSVFAGAWSLYEWEEVGRRACTCPIQKGLYVPCTHNHWDAGVCNFRGTVRVRSGCTRCETTLKQLHFLILRTQDVCGRCVLNTRTRTFWAQQGEVLTLIFARLQNPFNASCCSGGQRSGTALVYVCK